MTTKNFALIGQKAIILDNKNRLLLLQRSQKSGQGGKWSLAGGALENNEDPIEGITREILEETQLQVENIQPFSLFSYTNSKNEFVVMICYICRAKKQSVKLNWEHDNYKWMTKEELSQIDLGEHAELIIRKFYEQSHIQ